MPVFFAFALHNLPAVALTNCLQMRSSSVDEVQRFMEDTLRGAEIIKPVKLRDLLSLIRKHIAATQPDMLARLHLPDPATSQREINRLKGLIDQIRAKPQKTAEDYDAIQAHRRSIKTILSYDSKWAVPFSLTFFYTVEGGVERELTVRIENPDLRLSDEFWKVYHHATRQNAAAATLDFAHVYDIAFRLLVRCYLLLC